MEGFASPFWTLQMMHMWSGCAVAQLRAQGLSGEQLCAIHLDAADQTHEVRVCCCVEMAGVPGACNAVTAQQATLAGITRVSAPQYGAQGLAGGQLCAMYLDAADEAHVVRVYCCSDLDDVPGACGAVVGRTGIFGRHHANH